MNTKKMNCPKCQSEKIAPIPLKTIRRIVGYVYPRNPYLCLECRAHFGRFETPFKSRFSKIIAGLVAVAVSFIIVFLVLPKEQRPSAPEPSPTMKIPAPQAEPSRMSIPKMPAAEEQQPIAGMEQTETKSPGDDKTDPGITAQTVQPPPIKEPPVEPPASSKHEKELRRLTNITIKPSEGVASMHIQADSPIHKEYQHFILTNPHRLVIDLFGRWEKPRYYSMEVDNEVVKTIRVWKYEKKLRIVGDLHSDQKLTPVFQTTSDGLMVKLEQAAPKKQAD